jgi:hypothetical protein
MTNGFTTDCNESERSSDTTITIELFECPSAVSNVDSSDLVVKRKYNPTGKYELRTSVLF